MKNFASWQNIQDMLRRRIIDGTWKPGELIPSEKRLAEEFQCARATVNRALRGLADTGLLDRRRRAGSRVATEPSRYATLKIDIIRLEVERRGAKYRHVLIENRRTVPPRRLQYQMKIHDEIEMLSQSTLHLADDKPFVYEERWLNPSVLRNIFQIDFDQVSANEWLVRNVMFTHGDISFSAANITASEADLLDANEGDAAFVIERTTWQDEQCVTSVRLLHRPSFSMRVELS
ncbi:MAG: UTRA domain-containing protein [Gammaproteobacteria bacterium]|nr:UTRA domain-containing protein [Gammaproteobacteria bacterium]